MQKRLGVPDKEFEKYKFSIVSLGRQQVLPDDEYIVNIADFRQLPNHGNFLFVFFFKIKTFLF